MGTFWEDLGKRFGETAETVTNKAGEVVEVQKLKSQIRALERGSESDLIDLGRMVYEGFKAGETLSEEAIALCEAIQSREESIADYERRIVDVKGDFECDNCGKTVTKGMAYCPFCGTKAPEDVKAEVVEFVDELKEKASDVADRVSDVAEETVEKASDAAEKAAEKVSDVAERAAEKVGDVAEKAVEKVGDMAEKAAEKLKEAKEKAEDTAE